jgi:hypothetical protein
MTQNCSILVKIIKTALPINLPVNISMESSHCCKEALISIVFTTIAMKHLISAPIIFHDRLPKVQDSAWWQTAGIQTRQFSNRALP